MFLYFYSLSPPPTPSSLLSHTNTDLLCSWFEYELTGQGWRGGGGGGGGLGDVQDRGKGNG